MYNGPSASLDMRRKAPAAAPREFQMEVAATVGRCFRRKSVREERLLDTHQSFATVDEDRTDRQDLARRIETIFLSYNEVLSYPR